jgi:hypothetical protein
MDFYQILVFTLHTHNIIGISTLHIRSGGDIVNDDDSLYEQGDTSLLEGVLTHEYCHAAFDAHYRRATIQILCEKELKEVMPGVFEGPRLTAINEAFSFWAGDEISCQHMFDEQEVRRDYAEQCDVDLLVRFYHTLCSAHEDVGTHSVLDTFCSIVQKHCID